MKREAGFWAQILPRGRGSGEGMVGVRVQVPEALAEQPCWGLGRTHEITSGKSRINYASMSLFISMSTDCRDRVGNARLRVRGPELKALGCLL